MQFELKLNHLEPHNSETNIESIISFILKNQRSRPAFANLNTRFNSNEEREIKENYKNRMWAYKPILAIKCLAEEFIDTEVWFISAIEMDSLNCYKQFINGPVIKYWITTNKIFTYSQMINKEQRYGEFPFELNENSFINALECSFNWAKSLY